MDSAEFEIEESSEIDESSSDFGSLGALAPAWREGDAISEEEALTRRLEDKNGTVVCEYIDRNESVVSLRYTPKDGTILPITVCTKEDL